MKNAGDWYSYLSGSQSTLKIHVADTKMPLLKVANHNKVCYVVFMKWFFFFQRNENSFIKSIQNSFHRWLFTYGIHKSSHLCKTAVLRERQGKLYWGSLLGARDLSWRQERSWKPDGGQYWKISMLKEIWKNKNKLMAGEMGHGRIWFGWDGMVFSAWYRLHSWNSMVRSTSRQFGRLVFK